MYRGNVLDPRHGGPKHADWRHWEEEVGELLRTGTIAESTAMYGYLPGAFVLLVPFAGWPPRPVGVGLLAASNIASLLLSAWLVRRYWMGAAAGANPSPSLFHRFAGPVLAITAITWLDPIFANQLSVWVLAALVGGLTLVRLGRPVAGGMLLGLATTIKPPAGLLMAFCLWKREWTAAAGWCIGMAVFEVFPAVLFFGPEGAVREHRNWVARAAGRGHGDNIRLPWHAHRNQAASAVLRRWLRPLPAEPIHYVVRGEVPFWKRLVVLKDLAEGRATVSRDPLPPEGPTADPYDFVRLDLTRLPRLSLTDFDDRTIFAIWAALTVLAAAGMAAATAGAGRAATDALVRRGRRLDGRHVLVHAVLLPQLFPLGVAGGGRAVGGLARGGGRARPAPARIRGGGLGGVGGRGTLPGAVADGALRNHAAGEHPLGGRRAGRRAAESSGKRGFRGSATGFAK